MARTIDQANDNIRWYRTYGGDIEEWLNEFEPDDDGDGDGDGDGVGDISIDTNGGFEQENSDAGHGSINSVANSLFVIIVTLQILQF